MKLIFVSGGVISGLGKGITASSIGRLLVSRGIRVSAIKIDPYINVDAGTMNPYEHGEVYVLDDGSGTPRQILSGIHKFYEPEQLVGKTLVAILNLPSRKMMGQDSNGMLLSAVREVDGKEELHLLILDDSVPAGSQLC